MGIEIERKFLVHGDDWRNAESIAYRQGYLNTSKQRTVRVRVAGDKAYLTIKGITQGATRQEFEYAIPIQDATTMLDDLCEKPLIEKRRYRVTHGGMNWEVDEFFGDNQGLVLAELELESEDQTFDKPAWLGKEVTSDPRYYNANLVQQPYATWRSAK
jgi:CYTH domain-containing protein